MSRTIQLLFGILLYSNLLLAQHSTCNGYRYLVDTFMVDTTLEITFGNSTSIGGVNADLKMDIFAPAMDTAAQRPLVILAFGGSFVNGSRDQLHFLCEYYARRGYVAATIDYRTYDGPFFPLPDSIAFVDVVIKAISDMKAAVRFFREDEATSNLYKIDPNHIFVGGISSGAITASHVAYVDSTDTIEPFVLNAIQNNGGWQGNSSNNTQYSSDVHGVINFSGALRNANYIDANDPPLFSVHDDGDGTVPYGKGFASVGGFLPIMIIEGSEKMNTRATSLGLNNFLITIPNSTGHVSYFGNNPNPWTDSVLTSSATFLYDILCPMATTTTTLEKEHIAVQVYPNPSQSDITIEMPHVPTNYTLSLIDNTGRVVYQLNNVNQSYLAIPRNNLASGLYHLQVQFDTPTIAPIYSKVIFN